MKPRLVGIVFAMLLAGCSRDTFNPPPPRFTEPADIPTGASAIAVPISARVADLEQLVNAEVPRTLVTIDEAKAACVKPPVIGKIVKPETATAAAVVVADVRLASAGDW